VLQKFEGPLHDGELHKGTIKKKEGTVSFGRITPEKEPTGKPVMFLTGYGEFIDTVAPVSRVIANSENGGHTHDTFVLEHSRDEFDLPKRKIKKLYPDAPPEVLAMGSVIIRRAHEAILVLDESHSKAHLVGHSLGGMTAVAIALLRPDLVESLVLVNSAALTPKVHWTKLFGRFVANWWPEFWKNKGKTLSVMWQTLFSYMASNLVRAMREEMMAAKTDMTPIIAALGRKGVKISIIFDKLDQVFPSHEVEEQLKLAAGDNPPFKTEQTEGHMHYGPVMNPLEYGAVISRTLDAIESGE
jgi:pimeloyl-ACP methyl ester carboxylesterase